MQLLTLLAAGRGAAAVSEKTGWSLKAIADHLVVLRTHYGVTSTRAAIKRAHQLGHLPD